MYVYTKLISEAKNQVPVFQGQFKLREGEERETDSEARACKSL